VEEDDPYQVDEISHVIEVEGIFGLQDFDVDPEQLQEHGHEEDEEVEEEQEEVGDDGEEDKENEDEDDDKDDND